MNKSETIKELSIALSKFQGEVHNPNNTAINPFFKSKYAPLSEVLNTARPLLAKQGLSIIQNNYGNGEAVTVTTTLIHSSGEYIESGEMTAKPEKNTAQAMGSIITYLRRYQLSSILGLSSEDDNDGNSQENKKPEQNPENKHKPEEKKESVPSDKKKNAIKMLYDMLKIKNIDKSFIDEEVKRMTDQNDINKFTGQQLKELHDTIKGL